MTLMILSWRYAMFLLNNTIQKLMYFDHFFSAYL